MLVCARAELKGNGIHEDGDGDGDGDGRSEETRWKLGNLFWKIFHT
jgi:hypothetical protein